MWYPKHYTNYSNTKQFGTSHLVFFFQFQIYYGLCCPIMRGRPAHVREQPNSGISIIAGQYWWVLVWGHSHQSEVKLYQAKVKLFILYGIVSRGTISLYKYYKQWFRILLVSYNINHFSKLLYNRNMENCSEFEYFICKCLQPKLLQILNLPNYERWNKYREFPKYSDTQNICCNLNYVALL